jgi:excisionase family DNA binding protein
MEAPNILTASEAARRKGCSRQAIHAAVKRGRLTPYRMGRQLMIVVDAAFEAFEVKETGGRAHHTYRNTAPKGGEG